MGEMADYYLQMELDCFDDRWFHGFFDEPRYSRSPSYSKTCRKCGAPGFRLAMGPKSTWTLYDKKGNKHDCPAARF